MLKQLSKRNTIQKAEFCLLTISLLFAILVINFVSFYLCDFDLRSTALPAHTWTRSVTRQDIPLQPDFCNLRVLTFNDELSVRSEHRGVKTDSHSPCLVL